MSRPGALALLALPAAAAALACCVPKAPAGPEKLHSTTSQTFEKVGDSDVLWLRRRQVTESLYSNGVQSTSSSEELLYCSGGDEGTPACYPVEVHCGSTSGGCTTEGARPARSTRTPDGSSEAGAGTSEPQESLRDRPRRESRDQSRTDPRVLELGDLDAADEAASRLTTWMGEEVELVELNGGVLRGILRGVRGTRVIVATGAGQQVRDMRDLRAIQLSGASP